MFFISVEWFNEVPIQKLLFLTLLLSGRMFKKNSMIFSFCMKKSSMMLNFELKSMSTDAVLHPIEALSINYDNFENSMATFFDLAKALITQYLIEYFSGNQVLTVFLISCYSV